MCIAISICMYTFIRVRVCECDVISVRLHMCSVRAIAPHAAGHVVPFTCQSFNLVPKLFPLSVGTRLPVTVNYAEFPARRTCPVLQGMMCSLASLYLICSSILSVMVCLTVNL